MAPTNRSDLSIGQLFLDKKFPQVRLLMPREFVKHCTDREIELDLQSLERLDVDRIIHPCLRVRRQVVSDSSFGAKVYSMISTSASGLKTRRERGLVVFPEGEPPLPWKEYREGYEEVVVSLYHPLQVLMMERAQWLDRVVFEASLLEATPDQVLNRIARVRETRQARLEGIRTAERQVEKLVGLLVVLEDALLPYLHGTFTIDPEIPWPEWYAQWSEWRSELDWKSTLTAIGWSLEELRAAYEHWALRALALDPLARWYLLVQNIGYDKRRSLKGSALLAQDFHDVAMMVKLIYEYATDEKLPMPDDLSDALGGLWKERWYGTRNVFEDRKARLRLLTEFGLNPVYRVHLILEGTTETTFVPLVAQAMGLDLERLGIRVHGIDGAQKANWGRLEELLLHLAEEGAVPYLILDNDEHVERHVRKLQKESGPRGLPLLRSEFCTIWDGEFEEANFSLDEMAQAFNVLAESLGSPVRLSGTELLVAREASHWRGESTRITKVLDRLSRERGFELPGHREELAKTLAQIAINEIQSARESHTVVQPRPIVSELRKAAELAYALESGASLE